MSLRNEILLVTQAAQYVASPADSAGASATVESSANAGTQINIWLAANGQSTPNPWAAAFALAVYRNLNLDSQMGSAISPEAIWRTAFLNNLISPTPIRGCLALIVRLNSAGLLDEASVSSTSKVGIYCRRHDHTNELLLIAGNELLDDGTNDGVVLRFYDAMLPDPTDSTMQFVFVAPSCIRVPSVGLRVA